MSDYKETPLWNNHLSVEQRLDYLIQEMTLEEKLACLTTSCPDIERLGIRAAHLGGEAAHGIEARHDQAFNAGEPEPTTTFTQPIGMSASFDRELIRECGRVVGEEARALFARDQRSSLCRWAPTIDMERDPRWGRTEEAYGEDPYLTGEMSSAYIQGMKGNDPFYLQCGASLKHFYANNIETDRIKISSSVDERNKYEYYLEPFRKAIEEGGAEAVMTSYNEINGVPAIVNHEVQDLLKDTWKLSGHVVCDGGDFQQTVLDHQYFETHAETIAYGLKAGVDCFTDDQAVVVESAREALKRGLITEEDINRSIRNSFRTRIRLGFFDGNGDCPYSGMGEEYVNNQEHQKLCRQMEAESVVLLKNEKDFLPLKPEETSSLAVVGPLSNVWYKDWYGGVPPYRVTILDGIKKTYPDAEIYTHSGLSKICLKCNGSYIGLGKENRLQLTDKEHAEIFTFTDWGFGSITLIAESNGMYVTLEEGSYLIKADKKEAFGWFVRESWNFRAIGENCIEDLKGSYHLNSWNERKVTVDQDGYLVVIKDERVMPGEGDDLRLGRKSYAVYEGEPAVFELEMVENGIEKAAATVKKSDKAVLVIGCNPVINSKEEIDRATLALPPFQQKLADAVLEANPDTLIILISNYPYLINELKKKAPAILLSASGSQEMGNGISDVMSGKCSPAGRLPMTWYLKDEDLPDINEYDIIQGERTYQYFQKEVLYPFGYGLSYTEFSYGELEWKLTEDAVEISLPITNVGKETADEVVQLYVHKKESRVKRANRQLKGFRRVKELIPGETRIVSFRINLKDLRYFDVISRRMLLEDGEYTFMAGASCADIRQSVTIFISGEKAPDRDPFKVTQAFSYDHSEGCFIHRGTKGHTMTGSTCIIPGKPGDDPNSVDKKATDKSSCVLFYGDFVFDSLPTGVRFRVCGIENGEISLTCQGTVCRIPIERNKELEFEEIQALLPEEFLRKEGSYELQIQVNGKIKLAEFCFLI